MTIAFIFAIDDEAHREECRKHAWLLSEAQDQLHYERNLVRVLSERLDERCADNHRLADKNRAQAEAIRELAQLAADRLKTIAQLKGAKADHTRGEIYQ